MFARLRGNCVRQGVDGCKAKKPLVFMTRRVSFSFFFFRSIKYLNNFFSDRLFLQ